MGAGAIRESTLEPTDRQVRDRILPALVKTLAGTRDREIVAECLIALAKIGLDAQSIALPALIEPHLARQDSRVREAAILALGISQRDETASTLTDLMTDSQRGRQLVGRGRVSRRSRAFAAYSLGCIGATTRNDSLRIEIAETLRAGLAEPSPDLDIRVASMHALGALDLRAERRPDRRTLAKSVHALMTFFEFEGGASLERVQAHAPTAVAKLLLRMSDPGLAEWTKSRLAGQLERRRDERRGRHVVRSALIGLGLLSNPVDDSDAHDHRFAELLWHEYQTAKDEQSRSFALVSMAQMGGVINRDRLLHALRGRTMQRPWAAIALGVYCHARRQEDSMGGRSDSVVTDALHRVLREHKNPDFLASTAIALGLCGAEEAAPDLRAMLSRYRQRSFLGGYLCTSLALLADDFSADTIQSTVLAAENKPKLLRRGAIALALLQQKQTANHLLGILRGGDASSAQVAAIAPALSRIGDRNVVDPLVAILDHDGLTDTSQAMIALALGGVADKEQLPWYVRYAENANYRAAVPSLSGAGNGILDRY